MKKILFALFIFLLCTFFCFPSHILAYFDQESLPSITLINPIRSSGLGHEKDNLLVSLRGQWKTTDAFHIPATWLWQYSALEDSSLTTFAKTNMHNQEFGLFFEIDSNFANKAGVQYRGRGPWYFSDGLFLMSYDQDERICLIDTAFAKFKQTFGYYPKTVGAWWIDADSLVYMQRKYGILASLRASDQFALDVYTIWGTPWSIPYLSSKENAGMPASSWDISAKIVMMQWAARDPTAGYGGSGDYSMYSTQDFETKGYDIAYFNYLSSIYLKGPGDQIVIGLENGGSPPFYENGTYKKVLQQAAKLRESHKVNIVLAKDYAKNFLASKNIFPSTYYYLSKDFKTNDQSFWYNTGSYRAGIQKIGDSIYLVDLRNYAKKTSEDFAILPNSQAMLRIDEPSIVDSAYFPGQKLFLAKSNEPLRINQNNHGLTLLGGNKKIAFFTNSTMQIYSFANKQTFLFSPSGFYLSIFWILFSIFFLYCIFFYSTIGNVKRFFIHCVSLFLPLVIAYPFLSSGYVDRLSFLFDKKVLIVLSNFIAIPFFPPVLRLLIIFQIVPFLSLLLFHYLFILRSKNYWKKGIFFIYLLAILILYSHVSYFPLDKSTFRAVFVCLVGFILALFSLAFVVFKKTKSRKITILSFVTVIFILAVTIIVVFVSRSKYIITPFEMDALQVIYHKHKDVIYLFPSDKPIYKKIRPLLYENYSIGGKLTNTKWQKVIRGKNMMLILPDHTNKLLVIPRYLGSDISSEETQRYGLRKIFENGQIAILENK